MGVATLQPESDQRSGRGAINDDKSPPTQREPVAQQQIQLPLPSPGGQDLGRDGLGMATGGQRCSSPVSLCALAAEAAASLSVFQHEVTREYLLVPPGGATELGPAWTRLQHCSSEQARLLARLGPNLAPAPATVEVLREVAVSPLAQSGARMHEAQAPRTAGAGGWKVSAARALRCRICAKELPNPAIMQEHLAVCGKVASAQEKIRACDEVLQGLLNELTQASEAHMRVMLLTGKEGGATPATAEEPVGLTRVLSD